MRYFNAKLLALLSLLFFSVAAQAQTNTTVTATANSVSNGATLVQVAQSVNANGGGTITLTAGTYYLTQSVVMGSNMTVTGAGPSTIIQLPSSPNGIAAFTSYGGSGMTISNMVMDGGIPLGAFLVCCGGDANPYGSTGVNMYSTNSAEVNVTLSNLEIRNFKLGLFMGTVNGLNINNVYVHDNNPGTFAHNVYLVSCDNVSISHSRFDDAHTGDGLHIDFGGVNTTIEKSEFSGNRGYGILSQQNVNVTMSGTRTDFNTNDGIQIDAAGLNMQDNSGSLNGGYGFNIPDTLDGNGHLNGFWGYYDGSDIGYFYEASIANITGNLSNPSTPNLYEAEQADGVLGPTDTADWTTAYSGFSGVGAVDFNANHLTNGLLSFSHVGAVAAGSYSMTLRYSNGTSATQTMALTVNGVAQTALSFPSTGTNSTWSTVNFSAPLNAGNNVVAIGAQGSAAPEIDYLKVNTATPPAPAAPTGVTATAVSPYSVNLTWQPVSGASTYVIFQNGGVIAWNVVGTSYTDNRILFGYSSISYQVQAVSQGGSGAASAAVTVQTPIDSPAGFQGPDNGSGAGNYFNWMSANGASSFNLKRSTVSGGPYTTVVQIPNTTSLQSSNFEQYGQDTTATPGTTYYYVVTAVDPNGNESATHSYELAATTPYPTFSISPNPSSLTLAWGQSTSTTVAIQPLHGFSGAVNFSISGLPAGVTASFAPVSGNSSLLTLTASSSATVGTVSVTITGAATSGNLSVSTALSLTVATQVITFNAIPPQAVGTSLTLTGTASSGLPVSYTYVQNGNCTVSGNVVSFTNTGNCGVVANQPGNGTYGPAPTVGQVILVNSGPSGQTITFPAIATQAVGTPLALVATATSALPVSFASSTTGVCTVSGTTAAFLSPGTCTITASQAGNGSYTAATPVPQSFTVISNKQQQTITFNPIPAQTLGSTLTLSATASSGLAVTFSVVPNGNCSISGNVVTFLNTGNCGVNANQSGNSTYAAAPTVGQIIVVNNPTPQTITFNSIPAQKVGTPLALSATSTSGLTVTFASSTANICTVSGTTAAFIAPGTCGIVASQPGNSTYAAAASVTQSFTVNAALQSQTITFNSIPAQTVGSTLTLSATASSGLAVTFTPVPNGNCSISGNVVTFLNTGNCGVNANQAGNSTYAAAPTVGQIIVVNNPTPQTITFNSITAQKVGTPLALSATSTSGLTVTFASSTTSICTISGTTAAFIAPGTCTIVASQPGNSSFAAATPVTQSFTVTATLQSQTLTFNSIPAQKVGGTLALSATASSGLPVTYTVVQNGNCSISGNVVTFLNTGNCGVDAYQAGNNIYAVAPTVGQIIVVNNPVPQTITFNSIPAQKLGGTLTLTATASSGLAVTYTVVPNGNCSISGNVVTFLNTGNCGVDAYQAGNNIYAAAPTVGQIIVVNNAVSQTITFNPIAGQKVGSTLTVNATASSGLPITFVVVPNGNCSISGSVVTFLNAGDCGVIATQAGNNVYNAAPSVGQAIVVSN
jgi:hypothetical protein